VKLYQRVAAILSGVMWLLYVADPADFIRLAAALIMTLSWFVALVAVARQTVREMEDLDHE
jgi:hypothetical protein